jgi:hypothetical protein
MHPAHDKVDEGKPGLLAWLSRISVNLMSAVFASTDKVEPSDSGNGSQADEQSSQTSVFAFKVADEARPCEHR